MATWEAIIADHAPVVVRLTRRVLGAGPDAEDVTQEVFLEAFQVQQRQVVTNWGGLLRMIATRRALDRLRLRRRRPIESLHGVDVAASDSTAHENLVAAEMADRLRDAIAELPHGQAAVVSLRYFDNLSYEQIAETLDMEPNAVGAALYKAKAKLQTLLKVEINGAGP